MEILKSLITDYWKNIAIIILLLLVCCSCDVVKKSEVIKQETEFKEQTETITKRIGDTVTYEVPNVIFKDTIIYRRNEQGTILKTVYDKSGSIASIDCFASTIEEIKRENREFKNSIKDKTREKEKLLRTDYLILLLLLIFGAFYLFKKTY